MHKKANLERLTLSGLSLPAKALATCVILTLAFGMFGALGQIFVHDIIPTFVEPGMTGETSLDEQHSEMVRDKNGDSRSATGQRGDLFSDLTEVESTKKHEAIYKNEQFVWTLKWSHIHLFGMNMIFILMGGITLLLDISAKARTWLVTLPFIGVAVDIAAMWLKGFVSSAFFWLHIPGGGLFGVVFVFVSARALWEMWSKPDTRVKTSASAEL